MLSNSHGSRQTADTASNSSEYAALQLFTDFMQKTLSQDPAFSIYMQEWENFKTLLKANPIDYEKAYAHIYRFHGILAGLQKKPLSIQTQNQGTSSDTNANTNQQTSSGSTGGADPMQSDGRSYKVTTVQSPELGTPTIVIPKVNRLALIEKISKIRDKMDFHTDKVIRLTQKRDANFSSMAKFDDRTPLRRVIVYTDQNNKNDIFKEIENKLNYIKESNYSNYRFLNP